MKMNTFVNHSHQKDEETVRDPLGNVYGIMTSFLEGNVPDWDSPCMLIPTAQVFEESAVLLAKSVVGDQIAVQSSAGYWHHGIYLGLQKKDSVESVWIVDVWIRQMRRKRQKIHRPSRSGNTKILSEMVSRLPLLTTGTRPSSRGRRILPNWPLQR
jgi:hypothetical protein